MALKAPALRPGTTNTQLLQSAINAAAMGYKKRIPAPTQAGIERTLDYLGSHRDMWNPICQSLLNQLVPIFATQKSWSNPLAEFKKGMIEDGNGVEEIQTGLLNAAAYDPNDDVDAKLIFGREDFRVETAFHTKNRMDRYKVSVEKALIKSAFLNGGDVAELIDRQTQAPYESDQWDEFTLMATLLGKYEVRGGFYHVHVPDVARSGSVKEDATELLRKLRTVAGEMAFKSTAYNPARMPVHSDPGDMILLITPAVRAALDVEALAWAFNIDRADVQYRIVEIPQRFVPNSKFQAAVVDKNFFQVYDHLIQTNTIDVPTDPNTYNVFYHHHQTISCSRFAPTAMFWTGADDEVIEITPPVTEIGNIECYAADGTQPPSLDKGGVYRLTVESVTGGGGNPALKWTIASATDNHTSVSSSGALFVGRLEKGPVKIHVECDAASKDGAFAVTAGDDVPAWPDRKSSIFGLTVLGRSIGKSFAPETKEYTVTRAKKDTLINDVQNNTFAQGRNIDYTVETANGENGAYKVTIAVTGADGVSYGPYVITVK